MKSYYKLTAAQDDVSPYATYQLPDCRPKDDEDGLPMKTFGQLNTPTSSIPQPKSQTNLSVRLLLLRFSIIPTSKLYWMA